MKSRGKEYAVICGINIFLCAYNIQFFGWSIIYQPFLFEQLSMDRIAYVDNLHFCAMPGPKNGL